MDQEFASSIAVEAAGTPDRMLLVLYEDLIANSSATMELAYSHVGLHPGMYTQVVEESERHALPIFQSDISGKIHSGVSAVYFSKVASGKPFCCRFLGFRLWFPL
jgi:hypothetical protein